MIFRSLAFFSFDIFLISRASYPVKLITPKHIALVLSIRLLRKILVNVYLTQVKLCRTMTFFSNSFMCFDALKLSNSSLCVIRAPLNVFYTFLMLILLHYTSFPSQILPRITLLIKRRIFYICGNSVGVRLGEFCRHAAWVDLIRVLQSAASSGRGNVGYSRFWYAKCCRNTPIATW